jgi:hypothetical protein
LTSDPGAPFDEAQADNAPGGRSRHARGVNTRFNNGGTQAEYDAVASRLNIDSDTGAGWPAGLLSHAAGPTDDGRWGDHESVESREAQQRFMQGRLGRAIQESGFTAVPQTMSVELVSYHVAPGGGTS